MTRIFALSVLLLVALVVSAAQKDGAKSDTRWTASINLLPKAGKWQLREAKTNTRLFHDRSEYFLKVVPKEMAGGTLLVRGSNEYGGWFPENAVEAKKEAKVFAIIRVRMGKNEKFDKNAQADLKADGWKELAAKVTTSEPKNEKWVWKAFEMSVPKGEVALKLKNLNWANYPTGVLFVVK